MDTSRPFREDTGFLPDKTFTVAPTRRVWGSSRNSSEHIMDAPLAPHLEPVLEGVKREPELPVSSNTVRLQEPKTLTRLYIKKKQKLRRRYDVSQLRVRIPRIKQEITTEQRLESRLPEARLATFPRYFYNVKRRMQITLLEWNNMVENAEDDACANWCCYTDEKQCLTRNLWRSFRPHTFTTPRYCKLGEPPGIFGLIVHQ
ncbi:hypothetical protein WN51_11432 [Melipona quadrifasciata]|uniref:Uncharacterized protein n=1 Tax=Melipona quadrifasciata TaxID=166423 RepID=A0A0N1IU38_9HYME|nr:hypothetical protein WN51_11432 [Melipona quadrifasciata]